MSSPASPVTVPPNWGTDLVDVASDAGPPATDVRRTWFGWSATSLPVAPLLLLGILFGPHGLYILTPQALAAIDPALPVALATLGAIVGLMPAMQGHVIRALGSAALAGGFTVTVVALSFAAGAVATGQQSRTSLWVLPLTLGVAAASSLIMPVRRRTEPLSWTGVAIEAETFMSLMTGALLLAVVRYSVLLPALVWLVQVLAVVLVLALAGWLLARRSEGQSEQRVFAVATLLLIGGAADYLAMSALAAGLAAGVLWTLCGGPARDRLQRDLLYALHPFTALVLVVAGARVEPTTLTVGLALAYACLRLVARIGVSALGAQLNPQKAARRLPLIEPGVFGVAFALSAFRALGPDMSLLVSVVVIGTIVSEVVALMLPAREATA